MASLLRPVVLEPCTGTGLRERRRSSVNTLAAVPRLFTTCYQDHKPVFDENDHTDSSTVTSLPEDLTPPAVPALARLRLCGKDSKIDVPQKCHDDLPAVYICEVSSPSSSSPTSTIPSRKSSVTMLPKTPEEDTAKFERLKWRLASAYFAYFLCGWGDGVTGTVLPLFMEDFHITYTMSSLLYAGSTIGFISGTLLVESIIHRLGRFDPTKSTSTCVPQLNLFARGPLKETGFSPAQAKWVSLLVSSTLHALFFVIMGTARGYWPLFCAYAVAAFARSILTGKNDYFASVSPPSIGFAYGLWSFGGFISPLVCQSVINMGVPWRHYYLGSLVLSGSNITFLVLTYRPTQIEFRQDRNAALQGAEDRKRHSISSDHEISEKQESRRSPTPSKESTSNNRKTLILTIRQPLQWAVSIFAFLYCGCETLSQSLIASYLLGARHANPKTVGYVSSGFWAGITVGRFIWGRYSAKFTSRQRKHLVLGCICIGLSMQLIICFVNSSLANSVATAVIGLVYGPVFPSCLALANDLLPSEVRMVSMALISAVASVGTSLFPFIAGSISSVKGIHIVPYLTVPLAAILACLWAAFPTEQTHKLEETV
ncbi:hypothetical protein HYPSUDRAFT_64204 [Hypholoma sublateritium FD-334 SS-4]|uniref:Major facilitator superfamily (MFS) profile domain-containing protein n=1 Tax=Hypholoma sublateritium (strain FD-334 SS-4) TaxID=945553 RepID=A0A0D2Q344_HYPSF|nr:hypothetical protein HYPSUDRAFT_64204 [Hypholoma sublateritium FD-334 SS-4]